MAKQRHLSRAPITEALIDIQVSHADGLTFTRIKDALSGSDFGYYVKNPIADGFFDFRFTQDGRSQTTTQSTQTGLRLHSADEKYVAQIRLSGLTLSRLPPYEEWSTLIEETRRIWKVYTERLTPARVTRVATRYINNLQLPLKPGDSYQTYLNKLVDVPNEAPQVVESFFQRLQLFDLETAARVNLTLALDATPTDGPAPVILDVDASTTTDLLPENERVWETLDRLRILKNRTFFGTITEDAAELYV